MFVDNAAVFASKGEMRKLVQGGGVSLNKEKLAAFDQVITTADLLDEKYLPDWAREKLMELTAPRQEEPAAGEMKLE